MTVLYEYDEPVGCGEIDEEMRLCKECKEYPCERIAQEWPKDDDIIVVKPEHDAVEHPNHYCQGGIECIDAIRASMSPKGFQSYCKGNVLKYIWRYEHKNGVEDLEKAQVYLNWMVASAKLEGGND